MDEREARDLSRTPDLGRIPPLWQLENVLGNCALKIETGCTFLSFLGVLVMMII